MRSNLGFIVFFIVLVVAIVPIVPTLVGAVTPI
jgi:hypothetical protein